MSNWSLRAVVLAALVAPVAARPAAAAVHAETCPVDRMAGRVEKIQGAPDRIVLTRGAARVPARVGACILYGDRLDASRAAEIQIDTDDGTKDLGQLTGVLAWDVPDPGRPSDPSVASVLDVFYRAIAEPVHSRPVTGVARDSSCEDNDANASAIAALPAVPLEKQRIGADLTEVVAAWSKGSAKRSVTVRLGSAGGAALATASACALSFVRLTLAPNSLKAGNLLVLRIEDFGGSSLEWQIEVVAPESLPRPTGQVGADWELAAWRLAEGTKDAGLDFDHAALSRRRPLVRGPASGIGRACRSPEVIYPDFAGSIPLLICLRTSRRKRPIRWGHICLLQ